MPSMRKQQFSPGRGGAWFRRRPGPGATGGPPAGRPTRPQVAGATKATGPSDRNKPRTAAVVPDATKFKLSAVVHSSSAPAKAIINGLVVKAGERIGDAKVVQIGKYTVELDVGGRRITVGMRTGT